MYCITAIKCSQTILNHVFKINRNQTVYLLGGLLLVLALLSVGTAGGALVVLPAGPLADARLLGGGALELEAFAGGDFWRLGGLGSDLASHCPSATYAQIWP